MLAPPAQAALPAGPAPAPPAPALPALMPAVPVPATPRPATPPPAVPSQYTIPRQPAQLGPPAGYGPAAGHPAAPPAVPAAASAAAAGNGAGTDERRAGLTRRRPGQHMAQGLRVAPAVREPARERRDPLAERAQLDSLFAGFERGETSQHPPVRSEPPVERPL